MRRHMASEAEFVEAFGEDADYVDVPGDVLDGESFLDKCLASPVTSRRAKSLQLCGAIRPSQLTPHGRRG